MAKRPFADATAEDLITDKGMGKGGRNLIRLWEVADALRTEVRTIMGGEDALVVEDFLDEAGGTLPKPWAAGSTQGAGTVTKDYVSGGNGGRFRLKTDTANEAQAGFLHFNDKLYVDPTKKPVLEVGFLWTPNGATGNANTKCVIGLATARNATFDTVAKHVWLRIDGANLNLLIEGDDATNDTDDLDTTLDVVKNNYTKVRIDCADLAAVAFSLDLGDGSGWRKVSSTVNVSGLAATDLLQVLIELQKNSAIAEQLDIDYVHLYAQGR